MKTSGTTIVPNAIKYTDLVDKIVENFDAVIILLRDSNEEVYRKVGSLL